jgi:hypothetical protein
LFILAIFLSFFSCLSIGLAVEWLDVIVVYFFGSGLSQTFHEADPIVWCRLFEFSPFFGGCIHMLMHGGGYYEV